MDRQRAGLTFIEFCVVVAVLAGLAWFVLRVPPGNPAYPRKSTCQANLKQIGLAFRHYRQDHDDTLPPATIGGVSWHGADGLLHPYVKASGAFECPSRPKAAPDYAYNDTARGVAGVRLRDVADPEGTILCLDYVASTAGATPPSAELLAAPEIARHHEGLNILFHDGHVKWHISAQITPGMWTRAAGD